MYQLYTWPTPNGRKVSIALEEFRLPYTVHPVDITKDQQFEPEFLQLSPNNKIPVLVDLAPPFDNEGNNEGINGGNEAGREDRVIMESGAILMYLADQHQQFLGDDYWTTLQWLMLQMGGIGPMLGQAHHFLRYNQGKAPYAEARYAAEAARLYGVLNQRLGQVEYLAGTYSIADMATWPWISRYEWQGIEWSAFPYLKRWYLAIAARPAVQRGYDVPSFVNPIPLPD